MKTSKLFLLLAVLIPTAVCGDLGPALGQVATADNSGEVDPGFGVDPKEEVDPGFGVDPKEEVDPGFGVTPPVDPGFGVDPKADIEEKDLTIWPVVIQQSGDNLIQMEKANAGYKAVNLVFQGMGGDASQSFA